MSNDIVAPIIVLSLICLAISGALAFTNSITAPVITSAAAERERVARYEIIPEADSFEAVDISGLPAAVKEAYKSTNDVGYIILITASGYGGDIRVICGIDPGGRLIHSKALEQVETKGLGSRITDASFTEQFEGSDSSLEGVSAITGATISSHAYISAIMDAFTAFELIRD